MIYKGGAGNKRPCPVICGKAGKREGQKGYITALAYAQRGVGGAPAHNELLNKNNGAAYGAYKPEPPDKRVAHAGNGAHGIPGKLLCLIEPVGVPHDGPCVPFGLPVVGVRGYALVIGKHVLLVLPYGVQSGALVAGGVKICAVACAVYCRGDYYKEAYAEQQRKQQIFTVHRAYTA